MKRAIWIVLIISIALSVHAELVDKIVARVGNEIILYSELERQINQMRTAGIQAELLEPSQILNHLVEQKLMVQKAKDMDIKVDEAAINKYAENYVQQVKSQYPSEAAFQADLAKMRFTQRDLQNFFAAQITENALMEQLNAQHIAKKVMVSDAEMMEYYEATKDTMAVKPVSWDLRMIMREVKASQETERLAESQIQEILSSLENGGFCRTCQWE